MAQDEDHDKWGVLLYYKFVSIAQPSRVADYFHCLCTSLSLRGRLRIAPDGINITVTGPLPALHSHIAALRAHPLFAFPLVDFKLSSAPPFDAVPAHLALDCGFSSLSVRLVPHLITLAPSPPPIANAGPHVSPHQFHSLLQGSQTNSTVLIDARNIYETRIGKFHPPPEVQFFDPLLRQYSDLPGWLDAHQDQLRSKRVLMYCTGGVRCELASSYLRSKGKDFEDVIQLSGGIHRYMEAFTDGGYFKGKNFVFDHRMAVASSNDEVVGRCLLCTDPFDDYSARNRCSLCRLLVLICANCQSVGDSSASAVRYVCELCVANEKASGESQHGETVYSSKNDVPTTKHITLATALRSLSLNGRILKQKLRILCLHGFRQNASSFKGRLGSLKKKLKHIADFVFVDAPHKLPFIQQEQTEKDTTKKLSRNYPKGPCQSPTWKYAWLVSLSDAQATASLEANHLESSSLLEGEEMKCAGLRPTKARFDPLQYGTQTEGWETSWVYLQKVFQDFGPFDGVLGFSQGAAVAAALCALRQPSQSDGSSVNFRFVVLCSGYPSPVPFHEKIMATDGGISCPSLHIYGGQDRQIDDSTSEQLSDLFRREERTVVKHAFGHIIPTKPEYIDQYNHFLSRFI